MTQHWIDLQHSDCIMIIGSNAAENHPMSFKWVTKAIENGAKLISVDPRFTRTSAKADIYGQLRAGTDIAFIGGMINYCIQNSLYNERYLKECTNACFLINPEFETCRDPGHSGVFSGLSGSAYDKSTWQYQLDGNGNPIKVADLEGTDPNYPDCKTSFSLLKEQFSTYTVAKVCEITGADGVVFNEICQTYCATAPDDKSATIMYAMGATQHTYGTQNVRSYAILQLLLGNIGVAGGGINALRGESNVQGSTDMCLLFHILPGYLATPDVKLAHKDLDSYIANRTPVTLDPSGATDPASANWWQYTNKYVCSLLKAWWPDADTDSGNDIKPTNAYQYLPKKNGDCSHITIFEKMLLGDLNGLMCWGQNPAVGGPNSNKERNALANLDFLVCVDLWETETAGFWKRPGVDPATINTEVWMLPAAASFEKEGSITNSGRWMQWRYKAATPPGDALEDLEILRELGVALQGLASSGTSLGDLNWGPYPGQSYSVPATPHEVAKEINGYYLRGHASQGLLVTSFAKLEDSGQTSSGNWLYCDSYDEDGNKSERTSLVDAVNGIGLYPGFSWCWPVNRRIIYNRASTYQSGIDAGDPLAPQKWVIRWTGSAWEGDVPDHGAAPGGVYPFIMKPEGHARLHGMGRADGPFPEHYEPWERPVNNAMSPQENNPVIHIYDPTEQGDVSQFPIIGTTYRVTEHWQGGAMTRNMPWLCELMPDVFCEMSEEFALAKGISNGDLVTATTERGSMQAVACVTKRFKPLDLNGVTKHQVGFIWHWGYQGYSTGNSANILTSHIGDPNTRIPEYKAFLCDINKT